MLAKKNELGYDERVRRIAFFFLPFLVVIFLFFITGSEAYACSLNVASVKNPLTNQTFSSNAVPQELIDIRLEGSTNCFQTSPTTYSYFIYPSSLDGQYGKYEKFFLGNAGSPDGKQITIGWDFSDSRYQQGGKYTIKFCGKDNKTCSNDGDIVGISSIEIVSPTPIPTATPIPTPTPRQDLPKLFIVGSQCAYQLGSSGDIVITVMNAKPAAYYYWWWLGESSSKYRPMPRSNDGGDVFTFTLPKNEITAGTKTFCAELVSKYKFGEQLSCQVGAQNSLTFQFTSSAPTGDVTCDAVTNANQVTPTSPEIPSGPVYQPQCELIDKDNPKEGYVCETAIGRIYTKLDKLVAEILRIILGLAGGIAVLLIIFSGYRMATSAGNPEQVQGARETITAAIVGLLFIIFSLVILEIIGVDILAIPGFQR